MILAKKETGGVMYYTTRLVLLTIIFLQAYYSRMEFRVDWEHGWFAKIEGGGKEREGEEM